MQVVDASGKVNVEEVTLGLDQMGNADLWRRRVPSSAQRLLRWDELAIGDGHAAAVAVRPWKALSSPFPGISVSSLSSRILLEVNVEELTCVTLLGTILLDLYRTSEGISDRKGMASRGRVRSGPMLPGYVLSDAMSVQD
jgi:hypothetical protein